MPAFSGTPPVAWSPDPPAEKMSWPPDQYDVEPGEIIGPDILVYTMRDWDTRLVPPLTCEPDYEWTWDLSYMNGTAYMQQGAGWVCTVMYIADMYDPELPWVGSVRVWPENVNQVASRNDVNILMFITHFWDEPGP